MSRIALPPSKYVRAPEQPPASATFVPRIALPDGSRVYVRHQDGQEPQRVALPRRKTRQ